MCNDVSSTFCKDDGVSWLIGLTAGIIAGTIEFDGVLDIVFPDSEDVSSTDWREEFDGRELNRFTTWLDMRLSNFNGLVEIIDWSTG
jgi:hypothetical protein